MLAKTSKSNVVIVLALALCVTAASAVAHVWTHLKIIDYGYRISKAAKMRSELAERNRRLRIELAVLKQPKRIADVAAAQFGLVHLEPGQLRRLRKPSVISERDNALASQTVKSTRSASEQAL